MIIEVGAPAILPLGLVRIDDNGISKNCWLGLTVQHPPVHVFAQKSEQLSVTGPRADIGYQQAQQFLAYHQLRDAPQIEIELAIPALVGLGSEAMLGLSIAKALAHLYDLPAQPASLARAVGLDASHSLETRGFEQGGLLLVDSTSDGDGAGLPVVRRRAEISHDAHKAWAFVFFLPRPAITASEVNRSRVMPALSIEQSTPLIGALWQAVAQDDIARFGEALLTLPPLSHVAIAPEHQAVVDVMRDFGVLAWGRSLFGLCYYGLVEGARASINLRTRLHQHLGPFGGQVMATITDISGARHVERPGNLNLNKYRPIE